MTTEYDNERLSQQIENMVNERDDMQEQMKKSRTTVLKQLQSLSRLTAPLFVLDSEYFGGKFQSLEDGSNPFQEIDLAVEIIGAAREHFSGQGAMGDSPELRDQLSDLIESLRALHSATVTLHGHGLQAVGVGGQDTAHGTYDWDEEDPIATLTLSVTLVREIHAMCQRTTGHIQALVAMRDDADDVRGQAEDELEAMRTSPELIAETARQETETLQQELDALRTEISTQQEQQAHVRSEKASHAALKVELEQEQSQRMEDMAEVRSLINDISTVSVEIAESVRTMPGVQHEDSESLGSAQRKLSNLLDNNADIAVMATAAESVFACLVEDLHQHIEQISIDLGTMTDKHERSHKNHSQETEILESVRTEMDTLRAALNIESNQVHAHEQSMVALNKDIDNAQSALKEKNAALESAEAAVTSLGDDKRSLKLELAEAERTQQTLADAMRLSEQEQRQQHQTQLEGVSRDERELLMMQEEVKRIRRESQVAMSAQEDAQREIEDLQVAVYTLEQSQKAAAEHLNEQQTARAQAEDRAYALAHEKDTAESALRAHKKQSAAWEEKIATLETTLAEHQQQMTEQAQAMTTLSHEREAQQRSCKQLEEEREEARERAQRHARETEDVRRDSVASMSALQVQIEQQAEGRRYSEAQSHDEKVESVDAYKKLEATLAALSDSYAAQAKELKISEDRYAEERSNREKKEADANERVRTALEEVETLRADRETQQNAMIQAEGHKRDAEVSMESRDRDFEKNRNARDAMQRQMAQSQRLLEEMEQRQQEQETQYALAETAWEQERIAVDSERQKLSEQIAALEQSSEVMNRSATDLGDKHNEQGELMRRMTNEYDDMKTQVDGRDKDIESLERQLDRVRQDLEQVAHVRDEMAGALANNEGVEEQQGKEISNLTRQLRDDSRAHVTHVDDLKALLGSARTQLLEARRQHQELTVTDREIIAELIAQIHAQ